MGKLKWHKRDHNAALSGMMALTLEERGAYNTILDLIYTHDGAVDDDERFISGWLRCDVRVWKRIRQRLLDLEKLYLDGGSLRNKRADAEVLRGLSRCLSAAEARRSKGRKSGAVSSENNGLAATNDRVFNAHNYNQNIDREIPPIIPPSEPALPAAPPAPDTKPKRRASTMPAGFALSSDMAAYAERKCPGIDAERTFEQFADHHRAKGSTFKDWPAAWRTWVNSPYGKIMRAGHHARGSPPRATIDGTLDILNRSGFFDANRHDTDPDGGGFDAAARGLPFYGFN